MNSNRKPGKRRSPELDQARCERDELQARLDRIVDITAGIIYILDPEGRFVFVNNAVEEILHYYPDELLGKHFSEIMPVHEYQRVSRAFVLPNFIGKKTGDESAPKLFDERRTGRRKTRNLEVQLITKSQKDVRIMAGDVTGIIAVEGAYDKDVLGKSSNKAAAFVGSQGLIFDITKYKQAEKERMEIQRRLLEIQKMDALGRLAEGIAHDFNNKLGTILGCAEMIKQTGGLAGSDMALYINPMISASKHAADLTGKLLLFARSSARRPIDVNVNALVLNVVQLLEHTADKRITISHELHMEAPAVRGDEKQIQSAILNIALNACEAMPDGGKLHFETSVAGVDPELQKRHSQADLETKFVRISIVDTGKGMNKETRARMFEPFFTTKTDGSSIGMGLTSVSNCVKNHGGFVDVASEPGKGTRVDAYLPLEKFEPATAAAVSSSAPAIRGTGRILVVDDEPAFLDVSKAILTDLGYNVVACINGREALDYYRANHKDIDLALIDLMMPELSGRDCLRELKKIDPLVKVVVCTGYGVNQEVEAALAEGVCGVIQKPFESALLSRVLSEALAK